MTIELDPFGPLPSGFLAVEASAGTGKTHTITTLVARFVAEAGVPAAACCVVTFTEAATAELRGRIRERLARLVRDLEAGIDDDELAAHLLDADAAEVARRIERVRVAVSTLDDATIATIHGFCARVLASSPAGASSATLLVDDHDVDEVVNDELLALFDRDPATPVDHARVAAAVRSALQLPNATLWPGVDVVATKATDRPKVASMREAVELVERCVAEVRRRRSARRLRSFDDLVSTVTALLSGPDGSTVVGQLRQRYRVVLIDEFQDTDTVQWDLFRRAFLDPPDPVTTVVVGDPKQAIYRFRSAELSAYLGARATADEVASLEVNWRSDGPVLEGLERVLGGVDFGGGVGFRSVRPAPGREASRLVGVGGPAVQLRCVAGAPAVPVSRRLVRADLVGVVHELLRDARLVDRHGAERPVRPRDIAVLTRANSDAARAAADLGAAGVPAATASGNSVLASVAADQWRYLLRGLVHSSSRGPASAAALSWFVGRRPDQLDDDDPTVMGEVHDQLAAWALALSTGGVPVLLRHARDAGLVERVLSRPTGARDLTDLEHVGELLLRLGGGRPLSPSAALALLDEIDEARDDEDVARDLLARRVDLDDDAVTVLTVHGAKGREFPVVLCPYLWTQLPAGGVRHAELDGVRRIDMSSVVGVKDCKLTSEMKGAAESEVDAEARRLVYVALTRAQQRLVLWWAPAGKRSPLSAVLGSALASTVEPGDVSVEALAELDGEAVAVVTVATTAPTAPRVSVPEVELAVATVRHPPTQQRSRWSFTALAGRLEEVGLRPASDDGDDPAGGLDEPALHEPVPPEPVAVAYSLADVPGGTAFGTVVHRILEQVDAGSPTILDDLRGAAAIELGGHLSRITPEALAAGLHESLHAPLAGPLGDHRLVDVTRADRLAELSFDLPLGDVGLAEIGAALADTLPADDPFAPWARAVAAEAPALDLAGMLTGSIDLVARHRDGEVPRFWVADYKTNRLGDRYDHDEMVDEMLVHHYPLQAALYLVALHRYLRWRLPGYDPAQHLLGAAYLFVRGMAPGTESLGRGVLWWRPGHRAVVALDRLLAGERS